MYHFRIYQILISFFCHRNDDDMIFRYFCNNCGDAVTIPIKKFNFFFENHRHHNDIETVSIKYSSNRDRDDIFVIIAVMQ
jgi:hypothetical protein